MSQTLQLTKNNNGQFYEAEKVYKLSWLSSEGEDHSFSCNDEFLYKKLRPFIWLSYLYRRPVVVEEKWDVRKTISTDKNDINSFCLVFYVRLTPRKSLLVKFLELFGFKNMIGEILWEKEEDLHDFFSIFHFTIVRTTLA